MLHAITAVKQNVQKAIDNAITAFTDDNPLVQREINDVLNPANEAQRNQYRLQILAALQQAKAEAAEEPPPESGDFYVSRSPNVGLAQSAMNAAIEQNAITVNAIAAAPFEAFGPLDPGWIECIIDGFKTLLSGKASFIQYQNLSDFLVAVPDKCTIALVADWGAHNSTAKLVAAQIRATSPDICVHLGDIYYAGQENEAEEFLAGWPMADPATGKISSHSSFALNGNHEMFSGGKAYFGTVLGAFGQKASFFGLRNTKWQLLAFDSAYIEQRLLGPADATRIDARLLSQYNWLLDKVKGNTAQQTILMSHHQPFSAFSQENSDGKPLKQDAENFFTAAGVASVWAWFFGHEHRCTIYDDSLSGYRARLIGNGCIPHSPPNPANLPDAGCQGFKLMNAGTNANGDALSGFVLLKLDGPSISLQYVNEDGTIFFTEQWTQV
ncbi:metallophosphoesterase [Granulicella sp. S156]|uniref:metallophosphoesterase family protein n=1 Tax=Granulicella sp. S156 TaxID=1747224 RepID=UPI00131E5967|nr:metallophosphoesterase [Granulicella sp. S156]